MQFYHIFSTHAVKLYELLHVVMNSEKVYAIKFNLIYKKKLNVHSVEVQRVTAATNSSAMRGMDGMGGHAVHDVMEQTVNRQAQRFIIIIIVCVTY